MITKEVTLIPFLKDLMRQHNQRVSGLAVELGVSHVTVGRWLSGEDTPSTRSCRKISKYSGLPLKKILTIAGHLPKMVEQAPVGWPEFREYALTKYPAELDEDLVYIIESLIDTRRQKVHAVATTDTT